MRRAAAAICFAACLAGCVVEKQTPLAEAAKGSRWSPAHLTHVRVGAEPLGETPNCQLQLPAVSPDGRHVAALSLRGAPAPLAALRTGEGLAGVSLYLQPTEKGAPTRMLCAAGAAWPTWSADSRRLGFIAYTADGRCDLALCDLETFAIRRKSVGFKAMRMAALNADGSAAAVVVDGDGACERIHVIDLASNGALACPAASPDERQVWPQWTRDGRVIYIRIQGDRACLAQWGPDVFPPEMIAPIPIGTDRFALHQAFAAVARPLSGDGRRFAWYDAAANRICLLTLADGTSTALAAGTRAGCWFGSDRFVAADAEGMRLFTDPKSPGARLMRGAWLPRGAQGRDGLIALTRGTHKRAFALARLTVTAGD